MLRRSCAARDRAGGSACGAHLSTVRSLAGRAPSAALWTPDIVNPEWLAVDSSIGRGGMAVRDHPASWETNRWTGPSAGCGHAGSPRIPLRSTSFLAVQRRTERLAFARGGHRGQSRGRCCAAKASWHSSPLVGSRRGASFYRAATGPTAASAPAGFAEYIAPDWLPLPIDGSSPQPGRRQTRQCHSADWTPVAHERDGLRSARGDIRRKVVGVVGRDMGSVHDIRGSLFLPAGEAKSRAHQALAGHRTAVSDPVESSDARRRR